MTPKDDRETVLRRRAFFVGSALSIAGCGPSAQPAEAPPQPVAVDAPDDPAPTPTASTTGEVPDRPDAPPDNAAGPNMAIPEGVSDDMRRNYENLNARTKAAGDHVKGALARLPKCGISECLDDWKALAAWLNPEARKHGGFMCGSAVTDEGKQFDIRMEQHAAWLSAQKVTLQQAIEAKLTSDGERKRWEQLTDEARNAHPSVCLKFACPDY